MTKEFFTKTTKKFVEKLNKHIIGQQEAKRAIALALRNRHRRKFVPTDIKNEIIPKNILMISPQVLVEQKYLED